MTTAPAVVTRPTIGLANPAWTKRLGEAWAQYRAYRSTLAELRGLTERQLSDVGMRRDALRAIAREAARKI